MRSLVSLLLVCSWSGLAQAAIFKVEVEATFEDGTSLLFPDLTDLPELLAVGDGVTLSFHVDTSVADTSPFSPLPEIFGSYEGAVSEFRFTAPTFEVTAASLPVLIDNGPIDVGGGVVVDSADRFSATLGSSTTPEAVVTRPGGEMKDVNLSFFGRSEDSTFLTTDGLFEAVDKLESFPQFGIGFRADYTVTEDALFPGSTAGFLLEAEAEFDITSVSVTLIPEPASIALLSLGGSLLLRRRQS